MNEVIPIGHCLVLAGEKHSRACGRAYYVGEVSREGEFDSLRQPIRYHYRCMSDSLLAFRLVIPPPATQPMTCTFRVFRANVGYDWRAR